MINSIVGYMNSGKTLYLTLKLYLDWLAGRTIITNYNVNFPHYKINKDYLIELAKNQKTFVNCSFGFDELWIWLDARRNQENTVATYFFLQSSKDDSPIYLTAQTNQQNDKRLRDNLHRISICNRILLFPNDNEIYEIDEDYRFLKPELQEFLHIRIKEYRRRFSTSSGRHELEKFNDFSISAKPIFKLFDTREKITKEGNI